MSLVRFVRVTAALSLALGFTLLFGASTLKAQAINESFDGTFPPTGWSTKNQSTVIGSNTTCWNQFTTSPWAPHSGSGHAGANFNCTSGTNTINGWLISPNSTTINNGDTVSFWTRIGTGTEFPDRLELRMSTNGASTNTGTTSTDVGDFTTLLLSVNPTLVTGVYPQVYTQFTATISGLSGTVSGRFALRYFVTNGGPSGANSNILSVDDFVYTPGNVIVPHDSNVDFDGDFKSDISIVRGTGSPRPEGVSSLAQYKADRETRRLSMRSKDTSLAPQDVPVYWYNIGSASGNITVTQWGDASKDFVVPADYDGDGKDDIAVWREDGGASAFYILQSATSTLRLLAFGQPGSDPSVTADYDGDGKDDPATYLCPAFGSGDGPCFYSYVGSLNNPSNAITTVAWGVGEEGDFFPNVGDFDGDGKADFCVQRARPGSPADGQFAILKSQGLVPEFVDWGSSSDFVIPGDYDGDGKSDFMVRRTVSGVRQHFLLTRTGAQSIATWGITGDVSVPGDYDGDVKTDLAVWRPSATPGQSAFYIYQSATGTVKIVPWGSCPDTNTCDFAAAGWQVH